MMYLDFGMRFKSNNKESVSIIFYCVNDVDLIIKRIQYFYDDKKWDEESLIYSVIMNAGEEKVIDFQYPDSDFSSYRSISFVVEDRKKKEEFHINIKYDDSPIYIKKI